MDVPTALTAPVKRAARERLVTPPRGVPGASRVPGPPAEAPSTEARRRRTAHEALRPGGRRLPSPRRARGAHPAHQAALPPSQAALPPCVRTPRGPGGTAVRGTAGTPIRPGRPGPPRAVEECSDMPANLPNGNAGRVTATEAAHRAIAVLRAAHGGPVMFVQPGRCGDCDDGGQDDGGPRCFPGGQVLVGEGDMLLGVLDGCTFHIDADLYQALGRPRLLLDVAPGDPDGISLAPGNGLRFVTRVSRPRHKAG